MGAMLAAPDVRQWLATPGLPARVRWPQCHAAAAVCSSTRTRTSTRLPDVQPTGRWHHLRIADLIRNTGTTASMGGADPAGRDDGLARNERARGRLRPGVVAYAG